MTAVTSNLRLRPAAWVYALFGLGGAAVLGMLWPGAILEDWRWLQAVAVVATLAWLLWIVALVRAEISIVGGRLRWQMLHARAVDLTELHWVALSPEAPDPDSPRAGAYQMWGVTLADASGGTVSFSARPSLWSKTTLLLRAVIQAVESSGALISETNWAMLRKAAGLAPAPPPSASRESAWVERFAFNRKNAAAMSMAVALIGLWPIAWVALRALGGSVGVVEIVWLVLGVVVLVYAWYDHRVGQRLGYTMRRDGRVEAIRRTGFGNLRTVHEHVDLAHAVHAEVEPILVVQGAVLSYVLRVRDAAGGATALPLGEGLVPPMRFWVQASELLERSGVELPEVAAREIAAVTGRPPGNPTRP